jgi:hypothetical protein
VGPCLVAGSRRECAELLGEHVYECVAADGAVSRELLVVGMRDGAAHGGLDDTAARSGASVVVSGSFALAARNNWP